MIKIINSLKNYNIIFAIGVMALLLIATTDFGDHNFQMLWHKDLKSLKPL
jgi:hypothetical protein